MAKVIVEGWRFIPHSFATVNQFQLLELLKRPEFELFHRDTPFWDRRWQPSHGLLDEQSESRLAAIPAPPETLRADVIFRTGCPFDFSSGNADRIVTFATCEFGLLTKDVVADNTDPAKVDGNRHRIVTPSRWSLQGLSRSGFDPSLVSLVPHGVDPVIFTPPGAEFRNRLRRELGWEDSFIFLNIGAMTSNKGIDRLLTALPEVRRAHPHARLVLKGLDDMYASHGKLAGMLEQFSHNERREIESGVMYAGGNLTCKRIAALYMAADAYVAPYLGEGFNMPVLEAAACGLPVICTAGGPTDDFTTADFAMYIRSSLHATRKAGVTEKIFLQPDQHHLTELMMRIIEDDAWRTAAAGSAARHIHAGHTWKHSVDALSKVLLGL